MGVKKLTTILTLLFVLILSSFSAAVEHSISSQQITIDGYIARLSPKMKNAGAVFMRIKNSGKEDDYLASGQVDIKNAYVELHDVIKGKMVKIDRIVVPSGRSVELKPGGLHVMILNLPDEVKENYEFRLRLRFEKSGEIELPLKMIYSGKTQHSH